MTNFRRSVFVDTSAYFAVANSSDEQHRSASAIWQTLIDSNIPLVTSNYVVTELHALMARTFGQRPALEAIDRLAYGLSSVIRISEANERDALALLRRYLDKTYTFVDAMSFMLIQNRRIPSVFTFDRHFIQHGFEVIGIQP